MHNAFYTIFSSREIAVGIYILIATLGVLFNSKLRRSLFDIITAFFHFKILLVVAVLTVYVVGSVLLLDRLGYWRSDLLKETILWFVFTGFVSIFTMINSKEAKPISSFLMTYTEGWVLLELLSSEYTFSLVIELGFVLVVLFLTVGEVVTRTDEGRKREHSFIVTMQLGLVIVVFVHIVFGFVADYERIWNERTIRAFFLEPLLSVLIAPCLYALLLYSVYDKLFIRINSTLTGPKPLPLIRYAKFRLLQVLGLRLSKVREFERSKGMQLSKVMSKNDLDRILKL